MNTDHPNTALLVMDIQNGIVSRYPDSTDLLHRIATTIAAARRAGILIVYVSVKFREGYPEISPQNKMFAAVAATGGTMTETNSATDIHPAVSPQPGDILVTKRRVGAFSGSDLEVTLRSGSIQNLVFCGIATSGVVLSTVRLASDLDYTLTVLSDCCADADEEVHRVLTQKVFPRQASVVTSDQWVVSL